MDKPILVIYNPVAGRGRMLSHWPLIENALSEAGVLFESVATQGPLEAIKIAAKAPEKYSAVVSAGGDGTTHEIANGLLGASNESQTIPLGVIPLGTGDDFVKMIPPGTAIGTRPFGWQEAVRKISRGETQTFDVGRITGDGHNTGLTGTQYFVNSLSLGFGAQAAYHMTTTPKYFKGITAYFAAILKTMIRFPVLEARFEIEGYPPFEQASTITAVMNGRCFGNGFWVTPDASADDGQLDLVVAQDINRFTILQMIPKLMQGTHVNEPILEMYRSRRVVIESQNPLVVEADGEIPFLSARRLEIEILPKRLQVLV